MGLHALTINPTQLLGSSCDSTCFGQLYMNLPRRFLNPFLLKKNCTFIVHMTFFHSFWCLTFQLFIYYFLFLFFISLPPSLTRPDLLLCLAWYVSHFLPFSWYSLGLSRSTHRFVLRFHFFTMPTLIFHQIFFFVFFYSLLYFSSLFLS